MPNFKCEIIRDFCPFEKNGVLFLGLGLGFCEVKLGEKRADLGENKKLSKNPKNSQNCVNFFANFAKNSQKNFDFNDLKEGQLCLVLVRFKGVEFFLQIAKKMMKNSQNSSKLCKKLDKKSNEFLGKKSPNLNENSVNFFSALNKNSQNFVNFPLNSQKNSQNAPKNEFLIKGEKHSKPQMIGLLQAALIAFKEAFCEKITNETIKLKPTRLLEKSPLIAQNTGTLLEKAAIFDEIIIEIGFGSGRHLLYLAKNAPNALVIGIEIYSPAIEQVAKLTQKANLTNILLIKDDARLVFSALPPLFAGRIFLHFPVPWDKQENRRVLNARFADEILRILRQKGYFHLRTDSENYYVFALSLFENAQKNAPKSIEIFTAKNENLDINSKYEARWKRQNKDIFDLRVMKNVCENKECKNLHFGKNALNNEFSSICEDDFRDFNVQNFAINLNSTQKERLLKNFTKVRFKGDDFFLYLENLYRFYGVDFDNVMLNFDENKDDLKEKILSKNKQKNSQNFAQKSVESLILQVSFGAFNQSEHHFLLLNQTPRFLFKSPFKTKENLKALLKLSEIFDGFLRD